MKDHLRELTRRGSGEARAGPQAVNIVREYLQARMLEFLQRQGAMVSLAFHGGTALRFLHSIPRYSEDLDFTLEREHKHELEHERWDFDATLAYLGNRFRAEGYEPDFKVSRKRTVHNAFVRFPGLMFDLGSSPHRGQVLSIKIEVDTRPPAGVRLERTVVRKHVTLHLQHHDRGSLLAGKLHALIQRPYTKGRDLFDLFWYLTDSEWPGPNLVLLNNALRQTGWDEEPLTAANWRKVIEKRLGDLDFKKARNDVAPFLEPPADVEVLTRETLTGLLRSGRRPRRP